VSPVCVSLTIRAIPARPADRTRAGLEPGDPRGVTLTGQEPRLTRGQSHRPGVDLSRARDRHAGARRSQGCYAHRTGASADPGAVTLSRRPICLEPGIATLEPGDPRGVTLTGQEPRLTRGQSHCPGVRSVSSLGSPRWSPAIPGVLRSQDRSLGCPGGSHTVPASDLSRAWDRHAGARRPICLEPGIATLQRGLVPKTPSPSVRAS